MMLNQIKSLLLASCLACGIFGCSPKDPNQDASKQPITLTKESAEAASKALWQHTIASLEALRASVDILSNNINQFLDTPNNDTLSTAQKSWIESGQVLRQYFFSEQLCSTLPTHFEKINTLNYRVAGYPIQPGFIDSYQTYEFSGLVNDMSMPLDRASLINQHGVTDSEEVILGLYAIEYLLFGEAGKREVEDFLAVKALSSEQQELGFRSTDEVPHNRRRKLLSLQLELLREDVHLLTKSWEVDSSTGGKWGKLSPTNKGQTIKETSEKAITRLLIEIVELNQPEKTDYSGLVSPTISMMSEKDKAIWLQNSIASVRLAGGFLPTNQQTELNQIIEQLNTTLKTVENQETPDKKNWEEIYALTKSLIELLNSKT